MSKRRDEQRNIIGKLAAQGGRGCRLATWIRQNAVAWTHDTRRLYNSAATTVIYIRVCPWMPSQRYVGMHTGKPETRDNDHLLKSAKAHMLTTRETLYHQKFCASHGGGAAFIDIPLYICPMNTERTDAMRLERFYIKQFGVHNRTNSYVPRSGPRQHTDTHLLKRNKPRRRRRVQSMRKPGARMHSVNNTNLRTRPREYTIAGARASCDLSVMVRQVQAKGGHAVVHVHGSPLVELSNTALLRRRYGDTQVLLTFADDMQIRTTVEGMLRRKLLTTQDDWNERVFEPLVCIEIIAVHWTALGSDAVIAKATAERVGTKPGHSRALIQTVTHPELLRVWHAARDIRDRRVRQRAKEQLLLISKRKLHVSLTCAPTIKYLASVFFPKNLIRRSGIRLLRAISRLDLFDISAMRQLEHTLKNVRSRAETCGQILINHKRFDRVFDPAVPHACACHRYPKEWRRRRQFNGHFCIVSEEYTGPGADAIQCSHKTSIETTTTEVYAELYRSLCMMKETLPLELRSVTTDQMLSEVVKSIIRDHCGTNFTRAQQPRKLEGKILKRDLLKAKKFLKYACISPVGTCQFLSGSRQCTGEPPASHPASWCSWRCHPSHC
eukprot:SAG11_NODE_2387_length_3416_cov_9.140187_3_plen_610_part_00